jgi:hypothetical protein
VRLRHCPLHIAGKLIRHGRRTQLKLDRDWPWSDALTTAFGRLRTTPQLCSATTAAGRQTDDKAGRPRLPPVRETD